MQLWDSLKAVDRDFTKKITGKSYNGDSPNPTYIVQQLTKQLGPIGESWGFKVVRDCVRNGKPHQIPVERTEEYGPTGSDGTAPIVRRSTRYEIIREENHEVLIEFWRVTENGTNSFHAYGGTPMLYQAKSGKWVHDEDAAKKSLTDAYVKGASWLGAAADIFLGIFDDKYTGVPASADDVADPSQDLDPDHTTPEATKTPTGPRTKTNGDGWD